MRTTLLSVLAGSCLLASVSVAAADEMRLSDAELDTVTAGQLLAGAPTLADVRAGIQEASFALLIGMEAALIANETPEGEEVQLPTNISLIFQNASTAPTAFVLADLALGQTTVGELLRPRFRF